MYESREEYDTIVRTEVSALERETGFRIRHGDLGFCPRCGEDGVWDVEGPGFARGFGNSIYYSTVFGGWRCRLCDIRRVS